jgi:hypothetical protein
MNNSVLEQHFAVARKQAGNVVRVRMGDDDDRWASPTVTLHKQSAAWRCPIKPIFAAVQFVASWHFATLRCDAQIHLLMEA